jgi:hypothetical protein
VLEIVELENELVLLIDNPYGNNVDEGYAEEDNINIVDPIDGTQIDKFYRFEGYQIYQMATVENGVSDIGDIDKARLVAQCDIENGISRIINFEFDEVIGYSVPVIRADGEDRGIRHSFKIVEDAFASGGNRRLVNHKKYYYIAVAYAYNDMTNLDTGIPNLYDPNDVETIGGQKLPYISSRLGADGSAIAPVIGIPHVPTPRFDGTIVNLPYGSSPKITKLDGRGNGNRAVDLTQETEDFIVANGSIPNPTFKEGAAPIDIKVIDPLNLVDGYFNLRFENYSNNIDTASWVIDRYDVKGGTLLESVSSDRSIEVNNEQLIPEWGISVQIQQRNYICNDGSASCASNKLTSEPIEATLEFSDSSKFWLIGLPDNNGFNPQNWITSGEYDPTDDADPTLGLNDPGCYQDVALIDPNNDFSSLLGGIITSGQATRYNGCGYNPIALPGFISTSAYQPMAFNEQKTINHPSVDIVFTPDQSKWTRCPVIELNNDPNLSIGGAEPGLLRQSPSVGKDGQADGTGVGMSWFPGYAIDVETGRRLNMAFGENSFLAGQNGGDMIWNPTSAFFNNTGSPLFGGQHTIYVFGGEYNGMSSYDQGEFIRTRLESATATTYREVFRNLSWVMQPMLLPGRELLATDVRVRVRINKEYEDYVATNENGGKPSFEWNMDEFKTVKGDKEALASVLDIINVVPNPYYAFSEYETDRRDTRVKITNLPEKCKVRIYDVSGKLVRAFDKDSPITSIDWDLKNGQIIPISGGVYLIHVEVPEIGERVVKFFCGMRQPDLENL